jgi:peptide/nickel transport system permease protein
MVPRLRDVPTMSLLIVSLFVFLGVAGPYLPVDNPSYIDLSSGFIAPGTDVHHPLGTDQLGRDVLARIVFGARTSLLVAVGGVAVAAIVGTTLGTIAGYFRGGVDNLVMRAADVVLSLPGVLAILPIIAAFGPSLTNLILVVAFLGWAGQARVVRSEVLSLRQRDFIRLAIVAGRSHRGILLAHILPNVWNTIIVLATLAFGDVILFEAGISFLGLGVQPPQVSWGLMLAESRTYLTTAWWLMLPGVAITLTVLSVNVLGDWLRLRTDPKQKAAL